MSIDEKIYLEPVYSQHVLELLRVGHEYCLLIEDADSKTPDELIDFIHKLFPMLYLKGLFLPHIETDPEEIGERHVTEEEWESVFNLLRNTLKENDLFWTIDPEITGGNEAVKLSLAENLTDVYQDLKDFIMQYQKSSRSAKEIAVNECRKWFHDRWGRHIAEASYYLHFLTHKPRPGQAYEDIL